MSVAVISGAAVGTLLLLTIIIIITIVIIVCRRRRKYNIDDNNVQLSHLPQQHTDNTSGQSLYHVITIHHVITSCDHTDSNVLYTGKHDPTTKLETANALYIPTKVKSVDNRGYDVTITPNPSYTICQNSHSGKELEYDYVQPDDGVVNLGGDKITVNNVTMDTNPSYSIAQNVKLEDNPSYDKLQL